MGVKVQVIGHGKTSWNEGVLAVVRRNDGYLGGEDLLAASPELQPLKEQFDSMPSLELSGFVPAKKARKSVVLLSPAQVKYQTPDNVLRILASRAVAFAKRVQAAQITFALESASSEDIMTIVQGAEAAAYSYTRYKSSGALDPKSKNDSQSLTINVVVPASQVREIQKQVEAEVKTSAGVTLARDLVNEIPAELFPERLAEQAKKAATAAGLQVVIYDEKRLAKENFNGVLTVGKGSQHPPRVITMSHKPAGKAANGMHLCLVGKGVTFDTGGHSLKSAKGMWEMKGDMAGAAAVIGAMTVIGQLKPKIRVTGIVPSAVNAIGPEAVLPGDIIRSRSGKTVHVDNTDAEGRLLLMDALHLAQEMGATHIIDVATLTGSIVRALGESVAGLFANDNDFAQKVIAAGKAVGEDFWQMPLVAEYRPMLDHPVADIDNVGKGPNGGAIVAALFLKEFVSDSVKWAHLDIAGCGLYTKAHRHLGVGGSGFAVRTLVEVAGEIAATGA